MTIYLTREQANKGLYGYCASCRGLTSARFPESVHFLAKQSFPYMLIPAFEDAYCVLPEFCTCAEQEDERG